MPIGRAVFDHQSNFKKNRCVLRPRIDIPISLSSLSGLQLKVQEAMRKKEKFQREHEEVSEKWAWEKVLRVASWKRLF